MPTLVTVGVRYSRLVNPLVSWMYDRFRFIAHQPRRIYSSLMIARRERAHLMRRLAVKYIVLPLPKRAALILDSFA